MWIKTKEGWIQSQNPDAGNTNNQEDRIKQLEAKTLNIGGLLTTPKGIIALLAFLGMLYTNVQQYLGQSVDPNVATLIKLVEEQKTSNSPGLDAQTIQALLDMLKNNQKPPVPLPQPPVPPPPVPPPPPPPPPQPKQEFLGYSAALAKAKSEGKPLIMFIGCPPRNIDGLVVGYGPSLDTGETNFILVGIFSSSSSRYYRVAANASDADIRRITTPAISQTTTYTQQSG